MDLRLVQVSAPAQSPITLTEFKTHARIDSTTYADDVSTIQTIKLNTYTTQNIVGTGVNVAGNNTLVLIDAGTFGTSGSVIFTIQESDDNSLFTNYGTTTVVNTTNDKTIYEIPYLGVKTYIRVVANVTNTASFSVNIQKNAPTSAEDLLITHYIETATEHVEKICNRAIISQTWDLFLDAFPFTNYISIPLGQLQSVAWVKYLDKDGVETTLTPTTDYLVDTFAEPARIVLPYGKSWASFTPYPIYPVRVRYTCGWNSLLTVPKPIKQALFLIVSEFYETRQETSGFKKITNDVVDRLLCNQKLWSY